MGNRPKHLHRFMKHLSNDAVRDYNAVSNLTPKWYKFSLCLFFPAKSIFMSFTVFNHLRTLSAIVATTMAIVPASWAQDDDTQSASPLLQPLVQIEGVSEYRLDNGLRILLSPDASKPNTTVNMTYLVGSRHENYGQTGMAHLLEHMLFRGTPSLPDALGEFSRRGLAANGSTNSDRTNYYASFSADPETLDWYIHWQADAMLNATISQEDLDSEMTVVRNEMERGENNPFQILMQKMQAAAFQWHNYGTSTIGARSDVENVDIEQLHQFYDLYYQPDNAVLIVSGRFDVDQTLESIISAFGDIERPERKLPPEYTVEPVQDGERHVKLRRRGGSPLAAAFYHIPSAGDPDYIALDLGVDILGETPSGRLYRDLVKPELATDVFGFAASMNQPGFALFGAQLEPDMDAEETLAALRSTLDELADHPFEQAELDRIRNQWLTGWSRIYADPSRLASALSEAAAEGDWRLFFWFRDQAEQMELDDVQQAVNTWLVPDNRTSGVYLPTDEPSRAPATKQPDLDRVLADYTGRETSGEAEAFDPTPDNLNARTERSVLALDNGPIELALLPKATRGDRVEARLRMQSGDENSLRGYRTASTATAAMLDRGTSKYSRQEIRDRLDALHATVNFSSGPGAVSVSMSTISEHLPELVELVTHIMREASFPEDELKEFKRRTRTAINDARSEPQSLASRKLARQNNPWEPDDIRYTPSFDESIESLQALTTQDLQAYHEQFYGAGDMLFTAVGEFDPDAIRQALTQGIEGWKQAPSYKRVAHPYHAPDPDIFHIDTPDKANAFYLSSMPVKIQDTDPDFAALYLANYLLGSSETSRLWNRVRTREGLSYNVRSNLDLSSYEPSGSWNIYAIFAPENTDRLQAAIDEEVHKVLEEGFTEKEVEEGVRALLNYRRLARTRDDVLARTWMHYLRTDRSFEWSQEVDDALQSLTAESVNQALNKAFDPDGFSTAIAADEEKRQAANDQDDDDEPDDNSTDKSDD